MAKKKETCNFVVTGEVNFKDYVCIKCGELIEWHGVHGICCDIKYGIKRR